MRYRVATLESDSGSLYRGRYKVSSIENIIVHVDRELDEFIAEDGTSAVLNAWWEWLGEMNVSNVTEATIGQDHRIMFDCDYDEKHVTFSGKIVFVNRTEDGRLQFVGNDVLKGFKVW